MLVSDLGWKAMYLLHVLMSFKLKGVKTRKTLTCHKNMKLFSSRYNLSNFPGNLSHH